MTTAATTTSASPSASNDSSPMIQDDIGASENTSNEPEIASAQRLQSNSDSNSSSASSTSTSSSSTSSVASPPQSKLDKSTDGDSQQQHHVQQQQQQSCPIGNGQAPSLSPNEETKTTTATASETTTTANASSITPPASMATTDVTPASNKQQAPVANASSHNNTEQKRPMNAFLLFCKRQRSMVREKYPNLENRGITKILGDWWSKLDKEQKSKYTDLARQHKEAFMKANPNFKWCKTPNVSNINNNNNNSSSGNISNDCYTNNSNNHYQHQSKQQQLNLHKQQQQHNSMSATNAELLSLQSIHNHYDALEQTSNGTSRHQLEAPKPPKKRFLERNDSSYTARNSYNPNKHDINLNGTDIVPYISLDQDTLDRVIDKAFSEDSNNSSSGTNTFRCSNRTTPNLTSTLGANPPILSLSSSSSSSAASTTAYPMSVDEPVDFSMNRTIISSRQQIINNLVEKMLSEPNDKTTSNFSKSNGTYSMRSKAGHSMKKDNADNA